MRTNHSLQDEPDQGHAAANAGPARSRLPGALMMGIGLVLILGAPTLVWLFRSELADLGPRTFMTLWYGAGGLVLLYLTAGLPLGALLLAAGGTRLYPASEQAGRVLLPLLGIHLAFFIFHSARLMLDWNFPFLFFALSGFLFVILFLVMVLLWASKRPELDPQRRKVADLQLGAGLCFFSAAWQVCGLVGAPGFALYPEVVQKNANQSFIAGQALAIEVFFALGFVFLLLTMWAGRSQNDVASKQDKAT